MRLPLLCILISTPLLGSLGRAQDAGSVATIATIIEKIQLAAGGRDALLSRFRIEERLNVSDDPTKAGKPRESIFDGHEDWWFRSGMGPWKKKKNEPAAKLVWVWTLQALADPNAKIQWMGPPYSEGHSEIALRISGAVKPAMEVYFDATNYRLVRIDWRGDSNQFSRWQTANGVAYPSKCVGIRKETGRQWYVSEITHLEKLVELPVSLQGSR